MTFNEVERNRYSCRNYKDTPVSRELLTQIMEGGRIAPSACNSQRWMFIAVDDEGVKKELNKAIIDEDMNINLFIDTVPALIAVVAYPLRSAGARKKEILGDNLCGLIDLDIGIAAQQMMYTATSLGLATVAMSWFDHEKAAEILNLPEGAYLPLIIGIGYSADEKPKETPRLSSEDVFRFNSYTTK